MTDHERMNLTLLLNNLQSAVRLHAIGPCAVDNKREVAIEQARHQIFVFAEGLRPTVSARQESR